MVFFSTTLTTATTAQMIMKNKPAIKRVRQVLFVIQSLGTATYVAIGGRDFQDKKFTGAGQSISIDASGSRKWVDISSIFCSADTADAIVEIFGESYDEGCC